MPQNDTMPLMMAWRMPPMPLMTAMMQLPIVCSADRIYVLSATTCRAVGNFGCFIRKRERHPCWRFRLVVRWFCEASCCVAWV